MNKEAPEVQLISQEMERYRGSLSDLNVCAGFIQQCEVSTAVAAMGVVSELSISTTLSNSLKGNEIIWIKGPSVAHFDTESALPPEYQLHVDSQRLTCCSHYSQRWWKLNISRRKIFFMQALNFFSEINIFLLISLH